MKKSTVHGCVAHRSGNVAVVVSRSAERLPGKLDRSRGEAVSRQVDPIRADEGSTIAPLPPLQDPQMAGVLGPTGLVALQRQAGNRIATAFVAHPPTVQRMRDATVVDDEGYADAAEYIRQHREALLGSYRSLLEDLTAEKPSRNAAIVKAITLVDDAAPKPIKNLAGGLLTGAAIPLPPAVSNADRQSAASLAVRVLNHIEQELATRKVVTASDVRDILIGTEFSFSDRRPPTVLDASINLRLIAAAARSVDEKRPHGTAKTKIAAWTAYAVSHRKDIAGQPTIDVSDHTGKAEYAKKVTYTVGNWSWYWVADIDEGCYETQTLKTRSEDLLGGPVKEIIEKHIFRGAAEQGLFPDRTAAGGGGHLSVDVESAFGQTVGQSPSRTVSFETLLGTLSYLQENATQLSGSFRKGAIVRGQTEPLGEADPKNAPWFQDERLRADAEADVMSGYRQVIEGLTAEVVAGRASSVVELTDQLIAFNQRLTNPAVPEEQKAHIEDPANISHYQAVNIEHLKKGAGASRLEVRDIPAQGSFATLEKDVKVILDAITAARDLVQNYQAKRLTS